MNRQDFHKLEKAIGYSFSQPSLLQAALTHSSVPGEGIPVRDLERLEFLGDRVLGLLTADMLLDYYPDFEEGALASRLNALVRKETCSKAAVFFGVDAFILMSGWEENAGGRRKTAILGDVMEALLGAVYTDGGLEAARGVYNLFWLPGIDELVQGHRDPKTVLQEWSQARRLGTPGYVVTGTRGPAHAPVFTVEVRLEGFMPATGTGSSKRAAQMAAASAFLERENTGSIDGC